MSWHCTSSMDAFDISTLFILWDWQFSNEEHRTLLCKRLKQWKTQIKMATFPTYPNLQKGIKPWTCFKIDPYLLVQGGRRCFYLWSGLSINILTSRHSGVCSKLVMGTAERSEHLSVPASWPQWLGSQTVCKPPSTQAPSVLPGCRSGRGPSARLSAPQLWPSSRPRLRYQL